MFCPLGIEQTPVSLHKVPGAIYPTLKGSIPKKVKKNTGIYSAIIDVYSTDIQTETCTMTSRMTGVLSLSPARE